MKSHIAIALLLITGTVGHSTVIELRSGNGSTPVDALITYLDGPYNTDFGGAFTPVDFSDAQAGQGAYILDPNPVWLNALAEDASARWVGTNPNAGIDGFTGDTALYAISFILSSPITGASLDLHYAVDNLLGNANAGLYLNGVAVTPVPSQGVLTSLESSYSNPGIGPLLHQGMNWMYLDAVNTGGPAGILFSATITATDIPEPETLDYVLVILPAFGVWRRRRAAKQLHCGR